MFRITTSYTGKVLPLVIACTLFLPPLRERREVARIICRSEPNPIGRNSLSIARQRDRPFDSCPEDALVLFNIYIDDADADRTLSFSFVVHRRALLKLFDEQHRSVAWSEWGPPVTRWFNMNGISTRWITITHGQRYVYIFPDGLIRLLDFNPHRVRRFKHDPANSTSRLRLIGENGEFPSDLTFEGELSGSLPCVECFPFGRMPFDAVLMDEERVIGLRVRWSLGSRRGSFASRLISFFL
jgi:hypothetical protein